MQHQARLVDLCKNIVEIYAKEDILWRQIKGDVNTAFFHITTSKRRRFNRIHSPSSETIMIQGEMYGHGMF